MSEQKKHELKLDQHLALLARMTQEFTTSLDIEETLHNAIVQMMDYMNAEAASIFLLENDDTELVCRACAGPIKLLGLRLPADHGIIGNTVKQNQVQMVLDVSADPDFTAQVDEQTGFTTHSILCAPLTVMNKKLGAIELINKKTDDGLFVTDDQHMLTALASSAALAIHNAAMAASLVEQERIQRELELAREIQGNLLPTPKHASFPIHGYNLPMREVSGDFYDYFTLPDGRIVFNLADVSGKGMNAALLMAKTSSLFHCLGKTQTSPRKLLAMVNNEVHENSTRGMFVTMVGGIFDPASNEILLANAGHQPPLLQHADGHFEEILGESPPLGILPNIEFPETKLQLADGSLYIYTDGVTESQQNGQMLGEEGLQDMINSHRDKPAAARLEAMFDSLQRDGRLLHDDVTVLVIENSQLTPSLCLHIKSNPSELKGLRDRARKTVLAAGCSLEQAESIVLAIGEAVSNIIQHAYNAEDGDIELNINVDHQIEPAQFIIVLRDYAETIDINEIRSRALDDVRPGGLGVHFMKQLMDSLIYTVPEDGLGNRLEMRITINAKNK
ncbi:MAG: SpoIIE family protein phosphatase [Sulfuriflexus sp.]|nr:SpoIIE family protein phosphatase [Sulfuriflexus sp.]